MSENDLSIAEMPRNDRPTAACSATELGMLTIDDVREMENIKLALPFIPILDNRDPVSCEDGELRLPPIYHEIISPGELSELCSTIESQIPFVGHDRRTIVRVVRRFSSRTATDIEPIQGRTALFATDPIEQHGPHLDLATDIRISEGVLSRLARDAELLRVPSIGYGSLRWALALGGSISLRQELHERMLRRYLRYLRNAGFAKAIVLSTHAAKSHLDTLNRLRQWSPSIGIVLTVLAPITYLAAFRTDAHAGFIETALSEFLGAKIRYPRLLESIKRGSYMCREEIERLCALPQNEFFELVKLRQWSGIVGDVHADDYDSVGAVHELYENGQMIFRRMLHECRRRIADCDAD